MICLDGSGALLRKGCACRGSSSWAHAECMARAAAAQRPRRGERAWSECQTCGQHFTGQMTAALACLWGETRSSGCAMLRATGLQNVGAYAEAERAFRDVLEACVARYGPTHEATLVAMGKLASAMQPMWNDEGKRAESETLWRRVHACRVRTLGAEHPLTLASQASLALVLSQEPASAQGRFDEAERLYKVTIGAQTRVMGAEHAHTLVAKGNYASMLSRRGDDEAAEPIFREVISAHRRLMGDLHPHTMLMCGNLAQCLANQHRYDEARDVYGRTARAMRDVLGPTHPDTREYARRALLCVSA